MRANGYMACAGCGCELSEPEVYCQDCEDAFESIYQMMLEDPETDGPFRTEE